MDDLPATSSTTLPVEDEEEVLQAPVSVGTSKSTDSAIQRLARTLSQCDLHAELRELSESKLLKCLSVEYSEGEIVRVNVQNSKNSKRYTLKMLCMDAKVETDAAEPDESGLAACATASVPVNFDLGKLRMDMRNKLGEVQSNLEVLKVRSASEDTMRLNQFKEQMSKLKLVTESIDELYQTILTGPSTSVALVERTESGNDVTLRNAFGVEDTARSVENTLNLTTLSTKDSDTMPPKSSQNVSHDLPSPGCDGTVRLLDPPRMETYVNHLENQVHLWMAESELNRNESAKLQRLLDEANNSLQELKDQTVRLNSQNEKLNNANVALHDRLDLLAGENHDLSEQNVSLSEKNRLLAEANEILELERSDLNEGNERFRRQNQQINRGAAVVGLRAMAATTDVDHALGAGRLQTLQRQLETARAREQRLQQQLQTAQERIHILEQQVQVEARAEHVEMQSRRLPSSGAKKTRVLIFLAQLLSYCRLFAGFLYGDITSQLLDHLPEAAQSNLRDHDHNPDVQAPADR